MTRYSLRPLPELTHVYEVAIGWDQAMATYFVAIFGPPDEQGDPVLLRWMGATFGEAQHPQDAVTYARRVAEVPCDLYRRLRRDRNRAPPPDSPPEPTIARFLTRPPLIDAQPES